jgi:ATP-binding cassette subfamily B protein
MMQKAFTQTIRIVQNPRPASSVMRLLARRPGRLTIALLAFAFKEIPLWSLPVVTAEIIDIVATGGEVSTVLMWFAIAAVLLIQNYPNHIIYTRNFMTVVRDTGAELRNALAARLQSLSIG